MDLSYKLFDCFERCFGVWNPKEDFYLEWKDNNKIKADTKDAQSVQSHKTNFMLCLHDIADCECELEASHQIQVRNFAD